MMKWALRWLRNIAIFFFGSTLIMVVALKFVPVYLTPLMLTRCIEQMAAGDYPKMSHRWVPLEEISPHAAQAVMASEDNLFLRLNGFDFEQIYKARIEAMKGKRERGASTITQQTAKNVFLWNGHSWLRKGLEAYFTVLIEHIWGKRRIMEVYLNSIETGNGIYGVEAVAQLHFGVHASQLTARQAALIAATLPNPRSRNSAQPTAYLIKRRNQIVSLMGKIDAFDAQASKAQSASTATKSKKHGKKKRNK